MEVDRVSAPRLAPKEIDGVGQRAKTFHERERLVSKHAIDRSDNDRTCRRTVVL
jgi:hypothetical protein